jgi:hypothetical protein
VGGRGVAVGGGVGSRLSRVQLQKPKARPVLVVPAGQLRLVHTPESPGWDRARVGVGVGGGRVGRGSVQEQT